MCGKGNEKYHRTEIEHAKITPSFLARRDVTDHARTYGIISNVFSATAWAQSVGIGTQGNHARATTGLDASQEEEEPKHRGWAKGKSYARG